MSIEQTLERIAASNEAILAHLQAGTPAPVVDLASAPPAAGGVPLTHTPAPITTAPPAATTAPTPNVVPIGGAQEIALEDLNSAAQAAAVALGAAGTEQVWGVISAFGVATLSELPVASRPELLARLKALHGGV